MKNTILMVKTLVSISTKPLGNLFFTAICILFPDTKATLPILKVEFAGLFLKNKNIKFKFRE